MLRRQFAKAAAAIVLLTSTSLAQALEKIVIQNGSPVPAAAYVDYYVAQEAGFFAEEGLDVSVRYAQGAPQAAQITASGGADVGQFAFEPYLYGYAQGMRGKFIFNYSNHNIFFMAVPADSAVRSVADLAGKTIGVSNMGSGSLIVARSMLRAASLKSDPSVFLPVGVGDSALQALKSGKVQALSLWDGGYAALERAGVKLRYLHHPMIGFIGSDGLFVADSAYDRVKDRAVGILRALVKARIFMRENPEAALRIYWKVNPASKQGASEAEALKAGMAELSFMMNLGEETPVAQIGRFDLDKLTTYLAVMKEEGVLSSDLSAKSLATNELMDRVGPIDAAAVRAKARSWK